MEAFEQLGPIRRADRQACTIIQQQYLLSLEPRLDFAHPVEVHDRRAMDAGEAPRVEPPAQGCHRVVQGVDRSSRVDANRVVVRFDPVDRRRRHDEQAAVGPRDEPPQVPERLLGTGAGETMPPGVAVGIGLGPTWLAPGPMP